MNVHLNLCGVKRVIEDPGHPSDRNLSERISLVFQDYVRDKIEKQTGISPKQVIASVQLPENTTVRSIIEAGELRAYRFGIYIDILLKQLTEILSFKIDDSISPCLPRYEEGWQPVEWESSSYTTRKLYKYSIKAPGVIIPASALGFAMDDVINCSCPANLLIPSAKGEASKSILRWTCICCGSHYICECFREAPEKMAYDSEYHHYKYHGRPIRYDRIYAHLEDASYRDSICHFCRGFPSTKTYTSPMYGGKIPQHYKPYISAISLKENVDGREAENIVRDRLGVPRIGEGWVTQNHLYHTISTIYFDYMVEREASPEWLGRQRFDIYLPEVGVAVEYQGNQHYQPVEHFGGEEGFEATKERDRLKQSKAKEHDVVIIEFRYDENLTEEKIINRIDKAIIKQKKKYSK